MDWNAGAFEGDDGRNSIGDVEVARQGALVGGGCS
jgi:hypothetical protein